MTNEPNKQTDNTDKSYQEIQRIYLNWHNGKRPMSGFIKELQAREQEAERRGAIAAVQVVLNTCKYANRELYLSTFATEDFQRDIRNNDNKRKAITAFKRQVQQLTQNNESPKAKPIPVSKEEYVDLANKVAEIVDNEAVGGEDA